MGGGHRTLRKQYNIIQTLKEINRKVERASRKVYLKLLETGNRGASVDQLALELELEKVSIPILFLSDSEFRVTNN